VFKTMTASPHPKANTQSCGVEQRAAYRIEVRGAISASWAAWFEGTAIKQQADIITIDAVADQAALRGLLCRLWDLNLIVISVNRVEADAPTIGGTPNGQQR
jgi:hypothetical protein